MHSFFEDHPSQHNTPRDTVLVGLCTGLLAAAAVSASQSILHLVANALKVVRIAFRIGVKVNDAAQRLSTAHDARANQSWSRVVVGVQKETSAVEVAQFNERKVRRLTGSIVTLITELSSIAGITTGLLCLHKLYQQRCDHD